MTISIVISIFSVQLFSADGLSYKEKIINEIINMDLIKDYYHYYYFADLNLDGKKEFIVANDVELSQCTVYYMKGSKLLEAEGIFAGPRNKLYYDTDKQKYVWNAEEIKLFRSGIYSYESGNINNTFNIKQGKVIYNMYSSWESVLVDERTAKRETTYYKGNISEKCKKLSKSQYNKINKNAKKNFVDAKAKTKMIEIYNVYDYSASELKSMLSTSYDTFSYKKMPKLSHKTVSIGKGNTTKLTVKNQKGKATFTSNNKKVATVTDNGVIKGKQRGTAKIIVRNNGITIKCKVSVI